MERTEQKSAKALPPFEELSAPLPRDRQSQRALLDAIILKHRQSASKPASTKEGPDREIERDPRRIAKENIETAEARARGIGPIPLPLPTPRVYTPEQMYQTLTTRTAHAGRKAEVSPTPSSSRMYNLLQGQIQLRPDHNLFYGFYSILFEKPNPMSLRRRGPLRKEALIILLLAAILLALFILFNWKALLTAAGPGSKG